MRFFHLLISNLSVLAFLLFIHSPFYLLVWLLDSERLNLKKIKNFRPELNPSSMTPHQKLNYLNNQQNVRAIHFDVF